MKKPHCTIRLRPSGAAALARVSCLALLGSAALLLSGASAGWAQAPQIDDEKAQAQGPLAWKVSGPLYDAMLNVRAQRASAVAALDDLLADADARSIPGARGGTIVLDVDAKVDARSRAYIESTGATITFEAAQWNTYVVEATLAQAEALAAMPEVNYMRASERAMTRREATGGGERIGSVLSEADAWMFANDARLTYGVNGTGETIGTISDSINDTAGVGGTRGGAVPNATLTASIPQNSADLPVSIKVVDFGGGGGTDEGTGMMELIHDLAPMAALAFGASGANQSVMAANILALANTSNSTVICDDIFFFNEPTFQDGPIAQAITTVTGMGIPYFTAAGNDGTNAIQGNYSDVNAATEDNNVMPNGNDFHNWGIATATPSFLPFTLGPGSSGRFLLYWNQPYATLGLGAGSQVDLDIHFYGVASAAGAPIGSSTNAQGNTGMPSGDPFERVSANNSSMVNNASGFLAINHVRGTKAGVFMRVVWVGGAITFPSGGFTGPTIIGHAMTNDGVSVAAMDYLSAQNAFNFAAGLSFNGFESITAVPESFTGLGGLGASGLPIFFTPTGAPAMNAPQRRSVPSVTALDGTNTSTFGTDRAADADVFPNFFGTSAAAPHAAAIAALMRDRNPLLSPKQIEGIMRKTAFDVTGAPAAAGEDARTGMGLINGLHCVWLAGADNRDDQNPNENDFVRMVVEIPEPIDLTTVDILVSYVPSDPLKSGVMTGGANPQVIIPDPTMMAGNLRIWTKNGNEIRDGRTLDIGGNWVNAKVLDPVKLGLTNANRTIDLWIEGVKVPNPAATDQIIVEVRKKGTATVLCRDKVRVTVQDI